MAPSWFGASPESPKPPCSRTRPTAHRRHSCSGAASSSLNRNWPSPLRTRSSGRCFHSSNDFLHPKGVPLRAAFGMERRRSDERFLISVAVLTLLADAAEQAPLSA